jgi:hypothetical protein
MTARTGALLEGIAAPVVQAERAPCTSQASRSNVPFSAPRAAEPFKPPARAADDAAELRTI